MAAVSIGLCLFVGACLGILALIGFLVWFISEQLGGM